MPPSRTALPSSEPTIAILTTSGRFARSARIVIANSAMLPKPDCTMPTTLVREPPAQGIGALRDERRDEQQREGSRRSCPPCRSTTVCSTPATAVSDDAGDQDRVAADHFSPESVASSASAIARIGWPVRCEAERMRA